MAERPRPSWSAGPARDRGVGGWNDAGNAATVAWSTLLRRTRQSSAFALDPDDFYDYQANRHMCRVVVVLRS